MTQEETPTLQQRLHGLAAFLPKFEDLGFDFGDGRKIMPDFAYSDIGKEFVHSIHLLGWVDREFQWGLWSQTEEGKALRDNLDGAVSRATPEQLCRLLTVIARQDYYNQGRVLEGDFDSGLLTAICRRAAELESEVEEAGE